MYELKHKTYIRLDEVKEVHINSWSSDVVLKGIVLTNNFTDEVGGGSLCIARLAPYLAADRWKVSKWLNVRFAIYTIASTTKLPPDTLLSTRRLAAETHYEPLNDKRHVGATVSRGTLLLKCKCRVNKTRSGHRLYVV